LFVAWSALPAVLTTGQQRVADAAWSGAVGCAARHGRRPRAPVRHAGISPAAV